MTESSQDRFEALLTRHRKIVFKVANSYGRGREDRRDLAQEITTQAWRAFPRYDARRPFSTWLYRLALNVAISFARRARRHAEHWAPSNASVVEPIDDRAATDESHERLRVVWRFIEGLDELNRALMLLYLDEHSYREIAEVLGITETNVATKINRLKQRIRDEVSDTGQR